MDADLEAMRSIQRFRSCVECLIEPLLLRRAIAPMPCKHHKTFELAAQKRHELVEDQGIDDVEDVQLEPPPGYCDCGRFKRRAELWEVGELTIKFNLTRTQMRELAHVMQLGTHRIFTYNQLKRTMFAMFAGVYKAELKAFKRKRDDDGLSFVEASSLLVAEWQFRMMPNA